MHISGPPFWSQKPQFWTDVSMQPKRPYRFILPIPLVVPGGRSIAARTWFSEHFTSNGAISRYNRWQGNENLFEFPVLSCTKPGFQTGVQRTLNGAGGYARIRNGQAAVYNFTPVIMEIADTISHDLESTITALLYGRGQVKSAYELKNNPAPGSLISFGNVLEHIRGQGCQNMVQTSLEIYEVDATTPFITNNRAGIPDSPGAPDPLGLFGAPTPRARILKLVNSTIAGAEFGILDYRNTEISTVRLTIEYDMFDYRMSTLPPSSQAAAS